jgi:hypothetical protein
MQRSWQNDRVGAAMPSGRGYQELAGRRVVVLDFLGWGASEHAWRPSPPPAPPAAHATSRRRSAGGGSRRSGYGRDGAVGGQSS